MAANCSPQVSGGYTFQIYSSKLNLIVHVLKLRSEKKERGRQRREGKGSTFAWR